MISPEFPLNWQSLAHGRDSRSKTLENSTSASIVVDTATREYPRTVSVYTIRTPSPGGQCDMFLSSLPAFFMGRSPAWNKRGAPCVCRVFAVTLRGHEPCQLNRSFSRLPPVRGLLLAAKHLASRRLVARPSARAPQLSPVAVRCAGRPSAQAPMWPTARSTPASATDPALVTHPSDTIAARARHARRFAFCALTSLRISKRTPHVQ